MMNSENKDIAERMSTDHASRPKRVRIASADGSQMAHLRDQGANRRKRVRISTSESIRGGDSHMSARRAVGDVRSEATERVAYGESRGYSSYHNDRSDDTRREYAKRYQTQRAEGNFDYHYNKANRFGATTAKERAGQGAVVNKGGRKKNYKPKREQAPLEPIKYKEHLSPDVEIRLNKFLANSGVCSRREADELIAKGAVTVNGIVVTELGSRVTPLDVVEYDGKRVEAESKVYVLLNKPKNCVTTSDDPECRLTVMDLVKNACTERIYPVGRLDRHTTGVLLITNDGELASKLTHPSYLKKKIYHVWLDREVSMEDMQRIADGIELEDGEIHADALSYVKEDDLSQVGIEIHSGRNRIIRRIFEHLGYKVVKLDRVYFAGLTKKNLPRGRWRYLNEQEVNNLRMGAFE